MASDYREEYVDLATGKLHLLRGGQGRPLLFLHHSSGSAGWLPLHQQLSDRFDVMVLDLPGYGGSERPSWAREPRDLAVIVANALAKSRVSAATLVGAGFGGFIAAEIATMNRTSLDQLVLIGAAGLQPEQGEIADQMLMSHTDYMRLGFRDQEHFAAVFGEEPPKDFRTLWDHAREMTARVTWKPYMFSHRLAPLLGDVDVPALLIWGEHDHVVPLQCGHRYQMSLANAKLEVVPAAGHFVELEEPERVATLITQFAHA